MSTNDERRRVAEKLREYASWDDEGCLVDCQEWGESVLNLLDCGDTEGECYEALADLIEPPRQCPHYHSDRHYCSVHEDMAAVDCDASATRDVSHSRRSGVDRHALLKLANRIQHHADNSAGHSAYAARFDLAGWAEVIREACGETQDD